MWKIDGAPNSAVRQIFDGKDLCRESCRFFPVHFEADGEEILVGLPDETVQLLTTTATRCMRPRCLVSDPEGRSLV